MALFAGPPAAKQAVDYFAAHIYQPRAAEFMPLLEAFCHEQGAAVDSVAVDRLLAACFEGLKGRSIRLDALVVDRLRYDLAILLGTGATL